MKRYYTLLIFGWLVGHLSAQQLFVPLNDDFVLYDLAKTQIIKRFHYQDQPFGVRPQISSDGRYLYYTKRLFNNSHLYQRDLQTNEERAFMMESPFSSFKLIADSRIILDEQETFLIPNVIQKQISTPYIFTMQIDNDRKELYFDEERYFLPSDFIARVMQAYYLVQEDQVVFNAFHLYDKEPWNNYYQWYLFYPSTNQLKILPHLRGALHLGQGGAFIGERVTISYIKNS